MGPPDCSSAMDHLDHHREVLGPVTRALWRSLDGLSVSAENTEGQVADLVRGRRRSVHTLPQERADLACYTDTAPDFPLEVDSDPEVQLGARA